MLMTFENEYTQVIQVLILLLAMCVCVMYVGTEALSVSSLWPGGGQGKGGRTRHCLADPAPRRGPPEMKLRVMNVRRTRRRDARGRLDACFNTKSNIYEVYVALKGEAGMKSKVHILSCSQRKGK